jgi:signal transduction histidine kinase
VDAIEDGVFPADQEHLDSIKEQTALLNHLVNDLRDLSLAESGQLKLDLQPVDITDLMQRRLKQFEGMSAKNIRLNLNASSIYLNKNRSAASDRYRQPLVQCHSSHPGRRAPVLKWSQATLTTAKIGHNSRSRYHEDSRAPAHL